MWKTMENHGKIWSCSVSIVTQTHSQSAEVEHVTQKMLASVCTRWEKFKKDNDHTIWLKNARKIEKSANFFWKDINGRLSASKRRRWRKNGYISRIPNDENHKLIRANHQHRLQDQSERTTVFGGVEKDVIYYELVKSGATVNAARYRQQLIRASVTECSERTRRHGNVMLIRDTALTHTAKVVKKP